MAELPAYVFKPHERPILPGSPATPDHPGTRRVGYIVVGALAGVTGGLGSGLITTNLNYVQGALGLYSDQGAWLTVAYTMTNICANLVLVKCRTQFGLQPFVRWTLIGYTLTMAAHLFVQEFWTAVLVRAIGGVVGSGLVTLCVLCLLQAMPPAKRLLGIMIGISIPQLAFPIARVVSPTLLEWGDWRLVIYFELGLALATLAALLILPLPPGEREKAFCRGDVLTVALFFPGMALLCAVLGLGRILWWTDTPWIALASIGAILLLTAALLYEHYRARPMLFTRWLGTREILRLAAVAITVRILLSEQTFGSIGLFQTLGLGIDQFRNLYIIITLASIAGLLTGIFAFNPRDVGQPIRIACVLIAIGAFLDAGSTNLTRPENLYLSQSLIGFGALYFIGAAMVIGAARVLLAGPQNFISWVVIFGATQNLGGLIGSAFLSTFQTIREKFHSHELVQQVVLTDPLVASRLSGTGRLVAGVVGDTANRSAEGVALLGQQVAREANILAYNDVFLVIGVLACLAFAWGLAIKFNMWRRGEISPVIALMQRLQAAATAPAPTNGPEQ